MVDVRRTLVAGGHCGVPFREADLALPRDEEEEGDACGSASGRDMVRGRRRQGERGRGEDEPSWVRWRGRRGDEEGVSRWERERGEGEGRETDRYPVLVIQSTFEHTASEGSEPR